MKRILFMCLATLCALTTWAEGFSAENDDGVTIYYDITSTEELTVDVTYHTENVADYTWYVGNLIIPETVLYDNTTYTVTGIGMNALNCSGLTSVTIPSTVTSIGRNALGSDASNVLSVTSLNPSPPTCASHALDGVANSTCILYVPIGAKEAYSNTSPWSDFVNIEEIKDETLKVGDKFEVGGLYYQVTSDTDKTVEVTWGGTSRSSGTESYTGDIIIPATVRYGTTTYNVTAIGSWAFSACTLTSINIPTSITSIGEVAFATCYGLTEIVIPDNVTSIGENAFYYCSFVTSITLSQSLTKIEQNTFQNCMSVEEITVPDNVTSIEQGGFLNCIALKAITLPEKLTNIGNIVFDGCWSLSEIYSYNPTPPSCTNSTFYDETPDNCVVYVPQGAKMAYSSAVVWQDFFNIKEIGSEVEDPTVVTGGVSDITKDTATLYGTVSAGSEELLGRGFQYWANTNSRQTIVATTISDDEISSTIQRLSSATEYTYRAYALTESGYTYGENKTFTTTNYDFYVDGVYYYKLSNSTVAVQALYYASTDNSIAYKGEVNIPSTVTYGGTTYRVTTINDYAFYECHDLTKVTIPESVTAIGPYSFYNCTSLEEATLPNNISTIWDYTFDGCASLKEVIIPSSVTTIRSYAFRGCTSITELIVPGAVKTLYTGMFEDCTSLRKATLEEGITNTGDAYMFDGCIRLEEVSLPNTMTRMGSYTFGSCTSLSEIKIPKGITEMKACVFYKCSSLTSVKLPEGITEIPTGLFEYSGVTSITIPDAITKIGTNAFRCTTISSLTIPKNVSYLEGWILDNCENIKKVYALNPEPATCQLAYSASDGSVVRPFTGMPSTCVLYVPTGTKEAYSTADGWEGFFADIKEFDVLSAETLDAQDITESSATLYGSITEGTFDMTEKGFEYWTGYDDATVVVVSDNEMKANITGLAYGTTYSYRAYAIDETGTRYGDTLTFTTNVPEGISGVGLDNSNVEGIYSISGQKLNTTVKGVNIIRYADGTTKKVIMK